MFECAFDQVLFRSYVYVLKVRNDVLLICGTCRRPDKPTLHNFKGADNIPTPNAKAILTYLHSLTWNLFWHRCGQHSCARCKCLRLFLMGGMGPVSLIFTPVLLTIKHISCNDFNELLSLPYNFLFFSVSPCGKLTYNYASKLFSASPLTKREILNAVYRGQIQWLTFAPQLLDPRLFSPFILYDKKLPSPNRHLPPVRWSSHSSEEPAA